MARHLLAIDEMDDWYLPFSKDYQVFASQYPLNGELERQKDKIEAMTNWCKEASITHTPTIFVDGKRLPENYSVNELKHLL